MHTWDAREEQFEQEGLPVPADTIEVFHVYWLDRPYGQATKMCRFSQFIDLLDAIREGAAAHSFDVQIQYGLDHMEQATGQMIISWELVEQRRRPTSGSAQTDAHATTPPWVESYMIPTLMNAYMLCRLMVAKESVAGSLYQLVMNWSMPRGVPASSTLGRMITLDEDSLNGA